MAREAVAPELTTTHRQAQDTRSDQAAGPEGVTIAPPRYGIDVVDRALPEETAELEPPEAVLQRQAINIGAGGLGSEPPPGDESLEPLAGRLAVSAISRPVSAENGVSFRPELAVGETVVALPSALPAISALPATGAVTEALGEVAPSPEGAPATEAAVPEDLAAADGEAALLIPEPPADLTADEQERVQQVQGRVGSAARVTAEMPSAGAHVSGARGAVEEPEVETQARADSGLVAALERRPEPSPEIEALCNRIYAIIRAKRPPDEESLVDADPQEMAEEAGGQLNEAVRGDAERVQRSYDELQEPQAGTPLREPQEMEVSPRSIATPDIDAAAATPDGVSPKAVSLEADVETNRRRQEEAGMTSPAAVEITDPANPVTQARDAQGELETVAEREPAVVLAEQQEALAGASADMAALQAQALAALRASRSSTVSGTRGRQERMVGSEAHMRTRVSTQAQNIVNNARTRVETLLRPLPETAMQRWETGVAVLSTRFEQKLARVERWIRERHSGIGGAFLGAIDYLTGLPGWVTDEYDEAEQAFGDGVCSLIREISTEVNGVIAAAEAIIAEANDEVNALFDGLPTELQAWADGERERFGRQLNDLHSQVQETQQTINQQLSDRASGAVQQVRERIHQLRQEAGGLVGRIIDAVNRFLEDPAKFIIEGILQILGIPPASFWALVNRIQQVISDIADDPLGFAGNLLAAMAQGFQQFFDNIGDHLLQGLLDWLFSGLRSVNVDLPPDLSLKSIVTFFLQLMGITWPRIRQLLARHIGEENVALIEQAWELVSTLIEQGPQGIFEMLKEQFDPQRILDMVMEAAIDFITEALITQVTARIIALFNPVGAVVQALEAIYRVLKWIFENAARIFSLVETVVNGIADILAGNIGGMASAIEQALARLIAPVIDFLAGYVSLGDLPEKIADVIRRMQDWVEGILDRVIGFLANQARQLLSAIGLGETASEEMETGDVRERAQALAMQRIGSGMEKDEIERTIAGIYTELQPSGLQRLELGPEEDDGEYTLFAEASPRDPILKLIPRGRRARMVVRITLMGEESPVADSNISFGRELRPTESGQLEEVRQLPTPLRPVPGKASMGGLIVPPEPESNQLKIVSWNTGEIDPRVESNATHAERQFVEWFEGQPRAWRARVTHIDININLSPCTFCAADLKRLEALMPSFVAGSITYQTVYAEGPLATTAASLSQLRRWQISPPLREDEPDLTPEPMR